MKKLRVLKTVLGTADIFPASWYFISPHPERLGKRYAKRKAQKKPCFRDGRPPRNKGVLKHRRDKKAYNSAGVKVSLLSVPNL